ncbi:DUF1173 family protein [Mesorhizobium sp. Root102]|nr:DUF1173 family protein [Mesorhizobium sp. Root102]
MLKQGYESRQWPLCLCREAPVAMYIARLDGQYLVNRDAFVGARP